MEMAARLLVWTKPFHPHPHLYHLPVEAAAEPQASEEAEEEDLFQLEEVEEVAEAVALSPPVPAPALMTTLP